MEQHKEIWSLAREYMRQKLSELTFRKWIEPLEAITLQNGILVVQAPDDTTKKALTEYYADMLRTEAQRANTQVLDVLLILPSQRKDFVSEEDFSPNSMELNIKYTFDSFVVGNSNRFAHAATQAVVQAPGQAYNPLFLYGGVGLGKTHLMHAVGHALKAQKPNACLRYVTSETFTNELIEAVRSGKNVEFRQRYRNVDLLMIDDVQFIAGKQSVQEEFFNTFNTLHNAGKQIILSSDRPPKEISALEDRLRSRFEWGLLADIQAPDIETRIAILRNRAQLENISVPNEVISFIAEHVQNNIRLLESSLTRVLAYARLRRESISLTLTKEALKDLFPPVMQQEITPSLIKECVAEYYGISVEMLVSQRRDKEVVVPRQIAMFLCHTLLSLPYLRISGLFDRSDHTTAISACNRIVSLMDKDPSFRNRILDFQKRLQNGNSTG